MSALTDQELRPPLTGRWREVCEHQSVTALSPTAHRPTDVDSNCCSQLTVRYLLYIVYAMHMHILKL